VAEGLSHSLAHAKSDGLFQGVQLSQTLYISHLHFVDDVLILCDGQRGDAEALYNLINLFSKATGMQINEGKSTLSINVMGEEDITFCKTIFPFEVKYLEVGMKYLGFHLKPNCYHKLDWNWLITKLEKRLMVWCFRWISRAVRLVLVKSILEEIPVYWISLT